MKTAPIPMMVRCKCHGAMGVARIEYHNQAWWHDANPEAAAFIGAIMSQTRSETRCWACRGVFRFRELRGTYNPHHECNSKCMASKGPTCECSCGGKNHGRSWA